MLKKIVILLSFVIVSCSSDGNKEIKTLVVNSFKVPCTGVAPMSCYQIKDSKEDKTWNNFYNEFGLELYNKINKANLLFLYFLTK